MMDKLRSELERLHADIYGTQYADGVIDQILRLVEAEIVERETKARLDEHSVLEQLGVGPFPLRVGELEKELAQLKKGTEANKKSGDEE